MAEDLSVTISNMLQEARRLTQRMPAVAARYGLSPEMIDAAKDWYDNRFFAPGQLDVARSVAHFLSTHSASPHRNHYREAFYRVAFHGFMPPGQTYWQVAAKRYATRMSTSHEELKVNNAVIDLATILQRASLELEYFNVPPMAESARILLHRLWSAERASDYTLPQHLHDWMLSFRYWTDKPEIASAIQPSMLRAFHTAPDPFILNQVTSKGAYHPANWEEDGDVLIIDGAHFLLGRGDRFGAFAAPVAGAILLADRLHRNQALQWRNGIEPFIPKEIASWIEPIQNLAAVARELAEADLLDLYGEANVSIQGQIGKALVLHFYDYPHWHDATDTRREYSRQYSFPIDRQALIDLITQAYLKIAGMGYISFLPQFFIHRATGAIRLAQLRNVYRMRSFPYRFFINSILHSLDHLPSDSGEDRKAVKQRITSHVEHFLTHSRLPNGINVTDVPADVQARLKIGDTRNGSGSAAPSSGGMIPAPAGGSPSSSAAPNGSSASEWNGQTMADVGGFDPSEQDFFSTTSTESATILYTQTTTTHPNAGAGGIARGFTSTTIGLPSCWTTPSMARPAGLAAR